MRDESDRSVRVLQELSQMRRDPACAGRVLRGVPAHRLGHDGSLPGVTSQEPEKRRRDGRLILRFSGTTNGGNLVTAGDVLFQAIGRTLYPLDVRSGKRLAAVPMKSVSSSTPLTYQVGDRQYVAIGSGATVSAFGLP